MNEENSDSQIKNLGQSLTRRLLIVSQNLEESVRMNGLKIEELTHTLSEQREILRSLREELNEVNMQKLFYILLGVSIGLAGRQILKDVLELLSR